MGRGMDRAIEVTRNRRDTLTLITCNEFINATRTCSKRHLPHGELMWQEMRGHIRPRYPRVGVFWRDFGGLVGLKRWRLFLITKHAGVTIFIIRVLIYTVNRYG